MWKGVQATQRSLCATPRKPFGNHESNWPTPRFALIEEQVKVRATAVQRHARFPAWDQPVSGDVALPASGALPRARPPAPRARPPAPRARRSHARTRPWTAPGQRGTFSTVPSKFATSSRERRPPAQHREERREPRPRPVGRLRWDRRRVALTAARAANTVEKAFADEGHDRRNLHDLTDLRRPRGGGASGRCSVRDVTFSELDENWFSRALSSAFSVSNFRIRAFNGAVAVSTAAVMSATVSGSRGRTPR